MRISASGIWIDMNRFRGFTLIELLVVMLLIVIVLGVAGLTLYSSEGRTLRGEAQRLALLIETAQQESVLRGKVLVLAFAGQGYEFMTLDAQGELVPVSGDDLLRPRIFPAGISVADISIPEMQSAKSEDRPQLILSPTGERAEFSITLIHEDMQATVEGSADGNIRLRSPS